MKLAVAFVLLASAAAGCLSGPSSTAPVPVHHLVALAPPLLNATDCKGLSYVAFLPSTAVSPEVPAPHQPRTTVPGDVTTVATFLEVVDCAAVRVEGVTEAPVRFGFASVYLNDGRQYQWEMFVDEPAPGATWSAFHQNGWPMVNATIKVASTGASIAGKDLAYSVTVAGGSPPSRKWGPIPTYQVHTDANGHEQQGDRNLATGNTADTDRPAVLQAQGGVWGRILAHLLLSDSVGDTLPINSDMDFRLNASKE